MVTQGRLDNTEVLGRRVAHSFSQLQRYCLDKPGTAIGHATTNYYEVRVQKIHCPGQSDSQKTSRFGNDSQGDLVLLSGRSE